MTHKEHAPSPPPVEAPPFPIAVLLLMVSAACILIGLTLWKIVHRIRARAELRKMQAVRTQVLAQINKLKTLRYCANQLTCVKCKTRNNKQCLIVGRCDKRVHHACDGTDCRGTVDTDCVICLDGFLDGQALRVLPCRHIFHTSCADQWLQKQGSPGDHDRKCPMCKSVVFRVGGGDGGATTTQDVELGAAAAPTAVIDASNNSDHRQRWRERVGRVAAEEPARPALNGGPPFTI